jgi:hypothetical protein
MTYTITIDAELGCYVLGEGHVLRDFDQVIEELERVRAELAQVGALPEEAPLPARGSLDAYEYLEKLKAQQRPGPSARPCTLRPPTYTAGARTEPVDVPHVRS